MISFGTDITKSCSEPLQTIPLEEVVKKINSDEALKNTTNRLRLIRPIDKKAYQTQKIKLPFICGSTFKTGIRNSSLFLFASYMVFDLDHCFEDEMQFNALRKQITSDPHVVLMFTSPGKDGIKAVVRLGEKIFNIRHYTSLYQRVAVDFAMRHSAEKWMDMRTFDATRICFICHDPKVYCNPKAEPIQVDPLPENLLLATSCTDSRAGDPRWSFEKIADDPMPLLTCDKDTLGHFFSSLAANQLLQLHHQIENLAEKELYKETLQILAQKVKKAPPPDPVSSDDLEKIRKKLNPDARIKSTISYYVPEILHETIGPITQKAEETGLSIKNVGDISYGKKITFEFKHHVAEINLFYGKNGFKVVKSPKRGHYPPLAEVAFLLVHNAIAQMNFDPTPADEDLQNLLDLLA